MNSQDKHPYDLAKERVLSNELLTKWLIELEERLRKLEASLSPNVTWEVSQAELAETEKQSEE
jgi:transposase-like protein